jgi:pyruvate/2-oxoglutarate/acetoin dehydrogenase E1 component
LINHAAKFRWMYNEQVRVPLVIRTPMGGRRGYGPTHSQTLEKLFLGVPGLHMLAPTAIGDPGELLYRAILETEDPLLFVENKLLYLLPVFDHTNLTEFSVHQIESLETPPAPVYTLTIQGAPSAELTVTTYGYMAELARQAMLQLAYEYEIFIELVVPTCLAPVNIQPVIDSASHTTRLLTVEEGTLTLGWGSEVLARCSEEIGGHLQAIQRLAAAEVPVPASGPLETAMLPGVGEIIQAARLLIER